MLKNRTDASKTGGLTAADRDVILTLAERGYAPVTIAWMVGKHRSTVRYCLYRHGLASPCPGNSIPIDKPDRRGRKGYGPAEDALMEALRIEGLGPTAIAHRLTAEFGHPRKRRSVEIRLTMLAARDEAQAAA